MDANLQYPTPNLHTKRSLDFTLEDIFESEAIITVNSSSEERSQISLWGELDKNSNPVLFIIDFDRESITLQEIDNNCSKKISLTDIEVLHKIFPTNRILIDITGMPHYVWAPLIRVAFDFNISTRVLYAEPESYKQNPSPASASLFDLSSSFEGLAPLPGFTQLSGPEDESKCLFVALMGFEGNRPERLVFQIDPTPKVIPVVGVPGFQIEFPTFTVACNRNILNEYDAYSDIRYVRASCPFDLFSSLASLRKDYPEFYMYIAVVGTKPHSLGAILYYLKNPENTEIMFDYPIKKSDRTRGIGTMHIYDFGDFNAL